MQQRSHEQLAALHSGSGMKRQADDALLRWRLRCGCCLSSLTELGSDLVTALSGLDVNDLAH